MGNKTIADYDNFLVELSNLEVIGCWVYSVELHEKLADFYVGKNFFKYLIKYINSHDIGTNFNIANEIPTPVYTHYYKALHNYLRNLHKCGFIVKTQNTKNSNQNYKLIHKIPNNTKLSNISTVNGRKSIQRIIKLKSIL